ncbi:serine/threonine protein kinase [Hyalangium rubrum]|uniref:non-specific serine/threonine protein kinase n=1 Tax=Hyalangium rubrum TaxID=3103134 RepID=A0ABU5HD49_9BACT|nr:serine/threonine-protein kinase [Hyalangium sp. s54d21]MDY7230758.1 serine/threonine-protein kinase [Hyalangium sp. s54d21]
MDLSRAPELHPASLPPGTRVNNWRILKWRGRGTYGAVYRAVRIDSPQSEPVALKLALTPLDPRFEREVTLLSRLEHPHVPALLAHGQWEHTGHIYPYLVMQWVEGSSLYDWAATSNPSSRQAMRVLAQVARALQATHAAGGVHRDVKGDNLLVRADGQACLMDFGSSHHTGASLLTFEPLPPGTAAYRSPEAWRFAIEFNHLRTAHYPANPADDLFALGVTAYRLVTNEYPPATDPGDTHSRLWYVDGASPRTPWTLNSRVDPQLSALILRMLSVRPEARGTARELAGLLEEEVECAGPNADQPLFLRQPQLSAHVPRPEERVVAQQQVAAEKAAAARREAEELAQALASSQRAHPPAHGWMWMPWLGAGIAVLVLMLGTRQEAPGPLPEEEAPAVAQTERPDGGSSDGGTVELAQEVLTSHMKETELPQEWFGISLDVPPKPLPGQRRPDSTGQCRRRGEMTINDGCWVQVAGVSPPCDEGQYEWMGRCYSPVYAPLRQPTSKQPKPSHGTQ